MAAAPPGTVVITVPHPNGAGITAVLRYDPATGAFAEPFAITVEGASAHIDVEAEPDGRTIKFTCVAGAHITAAMLAAGGVTGAAQIRAITVMAA